MLRRLSAFVVAAALGVTTLLVVVTSGPGAAEQPASKAQLDRSLDDPTVRGIRERWHDAPAPRWREHPPLNEIPEVKRDLETAKRAREEEEARLRTAEERETRRRSRVAHKDLPADQAAELAQTRFAELFSDRDRRLLPLKPGQEVLRYTGETTAVVKGAAGAEGASVVDSMLPLRARDEGGDLAPVDLDLKHTSSGWVPANGLVPVRIGERADDALSLSQSFSLAIGSTESAGFKTKNEVFFADVAKDTDGWVSPTPLGARVAFQLRSEDSPEELRLTLREGPGIELSLVSLRGGTAVEFARAGKRIGLMSTPVAFDADDEPIELDMRLEGQDIVVDVPHRDLDRHYPLTVDPVYENQDSWKWDGNGNNAGWKYSERGTPCTAAWTTWFAGTGFYIFHHMNQWYHNSDFCEYQYQAPTLYSYIHRADFLHQRHDSPHGQTATNQGMWSIYWGGFQHRYNQNYSYDAAGSYWSVCADGQPVDWACDEWVNTDQSRGNYVLSSITPNRPEWSYSTSDAIAYFGGARIWMSDWEPPGLWYFEQPPSGWVRDVPAGPYNGVNEVHVRYGDRGLGLWGIWMDVPGKPRQYSSDWGGCSGAHSSRCPETRAHNFSYAGMSEGVQTVTATGQDVLWTTAPFSQTLKIDRGGPAVTPSGALYDWRNRTDDHRNEGVYSSAAPLRVTASEGSDASNAAKRSGVKSIEILMKREAPNENFVRKDYVEYPCLNGQCHYSETRDWTFMSDSVADGDYTVRVVATDLVGNTRTTEWSVTVDRRGDIYHATAHTADPAVNGEEVVEEWAQYATLNARQVTDGQVTTRDTEPCGSSECGVVRSYSNPPDDDPSAAPGYTSFTGSSTTDARLEQVSELLAPANESLGPVLQSGPIAQALEPWQTAPPAHGSSYSLHEIKEPEDGAGANVAVTRLWIDAATKLPLKEVSLEEDGVAQAEVFYTYDRGRKTSAEVAADIFRVPPPADGSATEHWDWGTGNVPPDNPEGSDQDDEFALATDFRRSFGLTTDPALILGLLIDPSRNPDAEEWGTPLTASEKQTMDLRVSVSEAIGVVQAYGRGAGSSEYGGLYLDQANGGLVYVGFTGNAGAHLANLRSVFPYPDLLRTFTVGYTETQLYGTADAVSADKGWLASQGIDVLSISPSMKTNRVAVGVAQPTPASAAVLQSRYGSIAQQVQGEEVQDAARFKLYGGLSIARGSAIGARCAAGFSARSTGTGRRRYFAMTAGHCGPKGRIWYVGLQEVGRLVFSQHEGNDDGRPEHQRNVDIGYVKYKSRLYRTGFIRGNSPRDLRPIYSYDRYPRSADPPDSETHEGEPACIAGWRFKNVHCGTVTKGSTEVNDVHSLVEMEVNGGGLCRGESGAPAFYRSRAIGTLNGFLTDDEDAECGRRVLATQIEHGLNRVFAKLLVRRRP